MAGTFWHRELARFDAKAAIEVATRPPATWYVAPEFAALERSSLFRTRWQLACRREQVATEGSFVASSPGFAAPFVVTRDDEGVLRAFANVCGHRAAPLACGSGRATELVCPHHGWTYGLDGGLTYPPIAGREAGEASGLRPLAVETWGPWVFVCGDGANAGRSATMDSPAAVQGLKYGAHWRSAIRCNWKVYVGQSLAARAAESSATSPDSRPCALLASKSGAVERGGAGLVPNVLLQQAEASVTTRRVDPTAPNRCEVLSELWVPPSTSPEEVQRTIREQQALEGRDAERSEERHRELTSEAYTPGRYAPRLERATHRFHRLLHCAYAQALG